MKPGETIRIACGECKIVFDLCVAPTSEWAEDFESATGTINDIEPTCCPFCGAAVNSEAYMTALTVGFDCAACRAVSLKGPQC
jgi:hypothetical protein